MHADGTERRRIVSFYLALAQQAAEGDCADRTFSDHGIEPA
jgi:hypothetical protein